MIFPPPVCFSFNFLLSVVDCKTYFYVIKYTGFNGRVRYYETDGYKMAEEKKKKYKYDIVAEQLLEDIKKGKWKVNAK